MRIENTVEIDAPLDRVWALVNDIPRVAPCMPGAALTGMSDDDTYEGTVAVKLGPLRMSYKGKVTVEDVDEANHSARLAASGKDTKGAGTARASVETRLEAVTDTRTSLHVTSDVQLTGKVASFGRGGAINDVATRLFGQFADCLRATLEAEATAAAGAGAAGAGAAGTAAATAGAGSAGAGSGAAGAGSVGAETAGPASGTGSGEAGAAAAAGAGVADAGAGSGGTGSGGTGSGGTGSAGGGSAGTGAGPAGGGSGGAGAGASTATGTQPGPSSGPVTAGDGTTTAGAGAATPPVVPAAAPTPAPRAPEALDAGSLVGTVIKGRLQALFQAVARFFRRLFGRGRSKP